MAHKIHNKQSQQNQNSKTFEIKIVHYHKSVVHTRLIWYIQASPNYLPTLLHKVVVSLIDNLSSSPSNTFSRVLSSFLQVDFIISPLRVTQPGIQWQSGLHFPGVQLRSTKQFLRERGDSSCFPHSPFIAGSVILQFCYLDSKFNSSSGKCWIIK